MIMLIFFAEDHAVCIERVMIRPLASVVKAFFAKGPMYSISPLF